MAVFETKRQRGVVLVLVLVAFVVISLAVNAMTSARADADASRVEQKVRAALAHPPGPGPDAALHFLRQHDLTSLDRPEGNVLVTAMAGSAWSRRCVVGRRNATGQIATRVVKMACHEVRVTSDMVPLSDP
jgi:hypothetical protein